MKKPLPAGVFAAKRKDQTEYYRASLTYRGRHISLGSFAAPSAAHDAYCEGLRLLRTDSVSLISYEEHSPLPFEKWVVLLNFRDNGIYLGTPIYVQQRMFIYYLSPTLSLKFDMDDLFYFSSHKIMRRGNHYFVADYGMQVNIAGRYGIRSYAVCGRDYRFRNGDRTDFRRENLEIFNRYHGVRLTQQKSGQPIYTVRIHVRGNYIVGRYNTELEAAIAYNKAIDLLKKQGVERAYTPNYIEGLSPSRYAEIYSSLEVSPKLLLRDHGSDHFSR